MRRSRLVTTTDDATLNYVATQKNVGLVHRLAALAVFVRENPDLVTVVGDGPRKLITDLDVHPLMKAEELLKVDFFRAPDDIRALAQGMDPNADWMKQAIDMADELAPHLDETIPPNPTGMRLADAALEADDWMQQTQTLSGELVQAERFFDTVRGTPSMELVQLSERIEFNSEGVRYYDRIDNAEQAALTPEAQKLAAERNLQSKREQKLSDVEGELARAEVDEITGTGSPRTCRL